MNAKERGRRRFLKDGALLAGLTVGAIRTASGQTLGSEQPAGAPTQRPPSAPKNISQGLQAEVVTDPTSGYGVRSRFVTSVRGPGKGTAGQNTPLQDVVGITTPSALHFVNSHRSPIPDIDPRQHRLLIHGLVDRPLIYTLEELKRLPSVSRVHFIACDGNSYLAPSDRASQIAQYATVQQTHGKTACSEWTGVPLSLLLQEAGVQKGAKWLLAEGAEARKHTVSFPLAKAMDDALVVYGQNGEPVRPEQGFPLRLLLPGFEGTRNIKWLRRLMVLEAPYMTKWDSSIYTNLMPDGKGRWFQFELEPNSVITFPSGEQKLPGRGFYEITGLAWSGGGTVRRVEVSTDGGRSWKDAEIQGPVHRIAHTRFRFPWTWDGKEAVLQSRCTDERGDVQPSLAELSEIWGVNVDYWPSTTGWIQHFNAIQPWKVNPDGSVHNAIWKF